MVERQSVRRLRGAGAVSSAAIVSVLVVQIVGLIFLSIAATPSSRTVDLSNSRRDDVLRILYDSAASDQSDLRASEAALNEAQSGLADLAPAESALFRRFLGHPTRGDGFALAGIFDRKTQDYVTRMRLDRTRLRFAIIATSLIAIAVVCVIYFRLVLPVESTWQRMVKRLEEQRERFVAIFADSPDPMAIYQPDGSIVRGNAAAIRMLGLHEESVGKHWSVHVAEAYREAAQVAFDLAIGGSSAQFETVFKTASGAGIPVLCSISPISVHGKIVGVVGIAKDLTDLRASAAEAERNRQRFASMFAYHPDAIAVIDESGRIVRANGELERLAGYRADELVGTHLDTLAPAHDVIERAGLAGPMFSPMSLHFDAALRTKTGSSVAVRVVTVPMRSGDTLEGVYVIARDVTRERELEYRDRQQRERLRTLARLAALHAGSVERQISEMLQFATRSLDLEGSTVARVIGDQVTILHAVGESIPVGTAWPFAESFLRHIFGTNKVLSFAGDEHVDWSADPAQKRYQWRALIATTTFADGVPVGVVAFMSKSVRERSFEDADLDFARVVAAMIGASLARERREDELEQIAYIDPVTRLPNRRYAMDQLRVGVARAERSGERVIVYFIDLDGFKAVNDALGHAAGDEFLTIVSARLRAVLREGDVLARVGGDEFMAMQMTTEDDHDMLRLAQRLIQAASEPASFEGTTVSVGASIGIAVYPSHAASAEVLLDRADQAMYASKRAGKGQARLYDGIA